MKNRRSRSFKKELIYSFLTIGLTSIILLGIFQYFQLSSLIEDNQDSQTKVTEFLEDNIEGYMEQHGRIIETMSTSIAPLLENNQPDKVEEKLRDIKHNYPGFVNLYVGDKDGKSLVFYPRSYTDGATREHLDFSDRSYYKELLETNEQVISHVFHGRGGTDTLLVAIVSPIFGSDGKMEGYILGAIDLNALENYVSTRITGEASYAVLLDQDNNVIVHPDVNTRTEMVNLTNSKTVQKITDQENQSMNSLTIKDEGKEKEFITYAKIRELGWTVWIANPSTLINKPLRSATKTILWFIPITALVVVLASVFLTNRLGRTIRNLLDTIKRYTTSYKTNLPVELAERIQGPQEMTDLLTHFNDMMSEIEENRVELMELNSELEARVHERTSNLERRNAELQAVNQLITPVSSKMDLPHFIQLCLNSIKQSVPFNVHIWFREIAVTCEKIYSDNSLQQYLKTNVHGTNHHMEPIVLDGLPSGYLIVDLQDEQTIKPKEQAFLQTFSRSLAIMLQNKLLFERYRNKHAELDAVLESMSEGVMLLNNDHEVEYVNEFFLNVIDGDGTNVPLGRLSDVLDRINVLFEITGEELASFFNGEASELKLENKTKSGNTDFYMLHKFSVVSDEKKIGEGLLIRDITKEEEIDTLKNNLISLTSHEFKTPITNIRGSVETLLREDVEWEQDFQHELLEGVHEDIERIQHLVDDWMDISKIESGSMYIERNMVRADHVIEKSIELVPITLKEGATLTFHNKAEDYLFFYADKTRVQQVLVNLFTNALRYNDHPRKQIHITLEKKEKYLTIAVSDNGIGISKEHLQKIFNRFYQVDVTATRRSGGTGLGLSICEGIMEAHEGKIEVDSKPGEGSTFTLYFPIREGS
ncbi:HAMP domain-containing protein [Sporosarcina sp. BI001-red]|uniref:ATP-binding protein n=1 Tax=Sporosarcina sp. BI001-red TaxID=2282866 RepID=UPI000E2781BA|nr:ATP-binding protein [Sporosarcina sp. BI001-red]REB08051.1 HAMP domain-containing protein [Sporosarcina sp. BI001-red]